MDNHFEQFHLKMPNEEEVRALKSPCHIYYYIFYFIDYMNYKMPLVDQIRTLQTMEKRKKEKTRKKETAGGL